MDANLETEKLVKKPVHPSQLSPNQTLNHNVRHFLLNCSTSTTTPVLSILLQPFQWLQMLSSQLNASFILGIFLVHGLSQGFSGSYFKVVSDYYWKDVQKVQPSVVQLFLGLYYIPWVIKPVWGLLTDLFPVGGYRRRPYFILAGALGTVSATVVALGGSMAVVVALGSLIGVTAAMAIASVTIDACIARNSIEIRSLAPDLQTLCGFCSSVGSLVGYSTSGFFVHHLGAQEALGLLAVPQALLIVLGFLFYETKSSIRSEKAVEKVGVAMKGMQETIRCPQVWKPTLYIYLSLALSISTHEGQFYWYTDPKAGPAFSQEFVGIVHAFGALASVAGVLIYHKFLKDYPFRKLLFSAQLLYASSGMLDLIFMLRWNLILGVPDYLFVVMEECVSSTVSKIRWMPMIVLSTQLCPIGIEGTFFALLMCIDSLGTLSSKWGGGIVLHIFHVTRTNFTNLCLVVLIRNMLRMGTLALVFLVPNAVQSDNLLPSDLLTKNSTQSIDDESLQLVSMEKETQGSNGSISRNN